MANHQKPTQEELDAQAQKALEEAEALKNKDNPPPIETPKEDEEEDGYKPPPSKPPEEDDEDEGEGDPSPSPAIDYKKKFKESSREAQILHSRNKHINDAVEKAKSLPEPTEAELLAEFPDWELLTETEKKLAKTSLTVSKRFAFLEDVTKESKDIEAWNNKVDTFVDDPKTITDHPELDGKEEEFKIFVSKPTRRGVDFEDLIAAFLYDTGQPKKKSKGKMFETGSGGDKGKPKPKNEKISIEQARQLRQTNYGEYTRLLKAGKIETVV